MKKHKKKVITISIVLIVFILLGILAKLFYTRIVNDTDSIMERANQHFSGELASDPNDVLNRYNLNNAKATYHKEAKTVEYSLERKLVWHNFKDGFINVLYTCYYYDENGKLVYGAGGSHSKWIIHKENGEWKVTDIIEKP